MAKRPERTRKTPTRTTPTRETAARRTLESGRTAGRAREAAPRRTSVVDAPTRDRRSTREQRPPRPERSRRQPGPNQRLADNPTRPKNAAQAKARAKARKAKAPRVVRQPLRERILLRLSAVDLDPRRLIARVPFVVLVIGALGLGLGVTLWLSTDAAERSYELGRARQVNQALLQQKNGLERDVLEAQAAPALAEAARSLGMIPSRDTAHLVQDASGNWIVVGTPNPAQGVPPPPLNSPLPEPAPPPPPAPPAPRVVDPREIAVRLPSAPASQPPVAAVPLGAVPGVVPGIGAIPATVPAPTVPGAEVPLPVLPGVPTAPLPAAPIDAAPLAAPLAGPAPA
jgi:hypothetical protein